MKIIPVVIYLVAAMLCANGPPCTKDIRSESGQRRHNATCPTLLALAELNVADVCSHQESLQAQQQALNEARAAIAAAEAAGHIDAPMCDPTPPPRIPTPPPPTHSTFPRQRRSARARQLPRRYQQDEPPPPPPAADPAPLDGAADFAGVANGGGAENGAAGGAPAMSRRRRFFQTACNSLGLYKVYNTILVLSPSR
ncbi:hypothetical protein MKEN_00370000 [Mycena kentingensis (nom. inval.)]|nr:hypothetical protein MKEN_00370000 [Mycena kentingensis (nom. inval.)]